LQAERAARIATNSAFLKSLGITSAEASVEAPVSDDNKMQIEEKLKSSGLPFKNSSKASPLLT